MGSKGTQEGDCDPLSIWNPLTAAERPIGNQAARGIDRLV
jgi:hypothetical protein